MKKSEQYFRLFYENSPLPFQTFDHNGIIIEVNNAFLDILGYERKEVIGRSFADFLTETGKNKFKKNFPQFKKVGNISGVEFEMIRKDTSIITKVLNGKISYDRKGKYLQSHCVWTDITEKKQTKEALQKSEKRFRALITQAADAFFLLSHDGHILDVNQRACDSLGYSCEELLAMNIANIDVEVENQQHQERFWNTITPKKPATFEGMHRRKDGSTFPVEVSLSILKLGKDKFMLGLARDITERKQTEEDLRTSEERLQLAADAARMGLWDWNIITGEVIWSEQCKAHYGYPPETDMTYELFLKALHPDDRERVEVSLNRAVEERSCYNETKRTIWPDGSLHWTNSRGQVHCNTKGEPVRMVGVTFDISEQKQTEEETIKAHHELKRLFSFNEALLSAIPTPVFYKDKQARYLGCNKAFSDYTGVSSDQIKGKTVMELWPSENAEVYHKKDLELIYNPEQQMYEFKVQDKNGEDHPVIFAKNVYYDENKQVAGIVGAFLDISERKRAEQERLEHLRYLESMDRINQAIQATNNLEQMMVDVLDIIQDIFNSDRTYLLYPCDPDSPTWTVLMERNKPEYPGAFEMNLEMKMDNGIKNKFGVLLNNDGPQKFGSEGYYPLPKDVANRFNIKSIIAMALYPKTGKPWEFGIQQCSYARVWSDEEGRLIQEIGRRVEDALTSMLIYSNLKESEQRMRLTMETAQIGVFDWNVENDIWYASPEYYKMLGYDPKPEAGDRSEWLARVHPDDRLMVESKIREVQERKFQSGQSPVYEYEARMRHANGTYRWEHVKGFGTEHDSRGRLMRILGIRMDITEHKQAEQERQAHLLFFETMDKINRAIQGTNDLQQVMSDVLDVMLSIFDCDRAWLVYPCDPKAASWQVPMERTKPEYPGVAALGIEVPMDTWVANSHRILLAADGPVKFGPESEYSLPKQPGSEWNNTSAQSLLGMAIYPKMAKPYVFGMHQVSYPRIWTPEEERLFQEIGRRLEDALTSLLAHRNLRESELRYRTVFENSPVSIWEEDFSEVKVIFDDLKSEGVENIEVYFDQHPEIVQKFVEVVKRNNVNQSAVELIEATSKQELMSNFEALITPEGLANFRRELEHLWKEGTDTVGDAVIKTLKGNLRNVTSYLSICKGHEDNFSKVLISMVDVTKRKLAEEEIRQLNQKLEQRVADRTVELAEANDRLKAEIIEHKKAEESLRASEEKFRALVENINDVHFSLDKQGNFTYISPSITRFAHYEVEEFIGQHFTRFVHPDDLTELQESFAQTLSGINALQEFRVLAKDGAVLYVRASGRTQQEGGQVVGVTGIMTDITKRKYAEENIKKLNRDLQEHTFALEAANKELEAFAYSVSHDLRAPLRHIDGFLELLQNRITAGLDEKSQHYMETISDAAKRMGILIDDLLRFSRMGRQEMLKKPLDMNILLREIIRELEPDTHNRNIKWHIEELPVVTGDRAMLSMVLNNLISNAFKFTRQREQAEIEIGCMQDDDTEIVIYIRDNGIGFDPKYADRLFGVFQRLHRMDEFEGTGVGLASVRRIINRHGGKTWAEGKLNQGATFYFSLPSLKQGEN